MARGSAARVQRAEQMVLPDDQIVIRPPTDVFETLHAQKDRATVTMLDPWYNKKGIGGVRDDYHDWLASLIQAAAAVSDHVFVWGFPEILAWQLPRLPPTLKLVAWLTWYFKNCPSVIRGWRSAQQTCLHIANQDAKMYPEHFLNEAQLQKQREGKLRYMPGPPSVIDSSLIIGFVGRKEQVGHPAQKPEAVYRPLIDMTTKAGDLVLDPMCGSGTTGAVCRNMQRRSILCDSSEEYVQMTEKRLGVRRTRR